MTRHGILILSLLVLAPSALTAQESDWSATAVPRLGYFTPDRELGTIRQGEAVVAIGSAPTLGLSIEIGTPLQFVGLRATAQTTIGSAMNEVEPTSQPLDRPASVLNLSMDALLSPVPGAWGARPYGVIGVGLKRYDLGRGPFGDDLGDRFGGREAGFALNAGAGVEAVLGQTVVSIEAVDYMSGLWGRRIYDYSSLGERAFNGIRHDVFVSVGLKLKLLGR